MGGQYQAGDRGDGGTYLDFFLTQRHPTDNLRSFNLVGFGVLQVRGFKNSMVQRAEKGQTKSAMGEGMDDKTLFVYASPSHLSQRYPRAEQRAAGWCG